METTPFGVEHLAALGQEHDLNPVFFQTHGTNGTLGQRERPWMKDGLEVAGENLAETQTPADAARAEEQKTAAQENERQGYPIVTR